MTLNNLFPNISLEDDKNEFKGIIEEGKKADGTSKEDKWLKTLVGFANSNGGSLFIGVEDKTHKIVSLDHLMADKVIQMIHRLIKQKIVPSLKYEIQTIPITQKEDSNTSAVLIEAGKEFTAAGAYRILPLKANHDPASSPVIYAVESKGKRMLYAHDTGVFPEETFSAIASFGRFDFISFDCTGCLGLGGDWRNGHMSLKTVKEVFARLCALGAADENTVKVLSHFSHNGGQTYDEMAAAEEEGYIVAYDGLEMSF